MTNTSKPTTPFEIIKASTDWKSFKALVDRLEHTVEKGRAFEELTKHFLEIDPRYSTVLKNVWNHNKQEVPQRILKKLNLPKSDEGIDLVAETCQGTYWSIQCKYVADENDSIGRQKLSTFTDLSFNICNHIELALVCTSLDKFSHKLKLYKDQISFCAGENFRNLGSEFFGLVHQKLNKKPVTFTPYSPRKHQKKAIKNAKNYYLKKKESRGKMIMPCGAGKSLTAYWIAQELKPKTILIAVPSLALIRQMLEVWARESVANQRNIRWICVCSDQSVSSKNNDDQALSLEDLGIAVTTDPKEIAQWLNKRTTATNIIFTTYQSGVTISEASRIAKKSIDFGIFDEAHKTVGSRNKLFSHLLHDENIQIKTRLFMTATERHYRGSSDDVVSMDDVSVYGETFDLLTFKDALNCKPPILCDYKIVTITVTTDEINNLLKSNVLVRPKTVKVKEEVESKILAAAIQLRKAIQKYPLKHAISFHASIARAVAFKKTQENINSKFKNFKELECFHVTGAMPVSARQRILEEAIRSEISLITNSRCLTEGVDVKEIDGVLFTDPKKSIIDIVQAVGRALRPHPQKKMGYVLVPIVLDSQKLKKRIEQNEAYEDLLMTLRALASNDERVIETFRDGSSQKGLGGGGIIIEPPEGIDINPEEFANELKLRIWSKLAKLSWRPFEQARTFVRELNLTNTHDWRKYIKGEIKTLPQLPPDIPKTPELIYKSSGWVSMGDWLGTGYIASRYREYRSFEEARSFVHKLKLKNWAEWTKYCQKGKKGFPALPADIPLSPQASYKSSGWVSVGDWLGNGYVAPSKKGFKPFKEALKFARSLGLNSAEEWLDYVRNGRDGLTALPQEIPRYPPSAYKTKGWQHWGHWLGTNKESPHHRKYRSFELAREFVHTLGLMRIKDWQSYTKGELANIDKIPDDIPNSPSHVYKNEGWKSWGDWLGTFYVNPVSRNYLDFDSARKFTRKLGLKNHKEWVQYCENSIKGVSKIPDNIPKHPQQKYKGEGWINWNDWLDSDFVPLSKREFKPFDDARKFARKLGLLHSKDWNEYCKNKKVGYLPKPADIPSLPQRTYENSGWNGWNDWLGSDYIAANKIQFRNFEEARAYVRELGLTHQQEWKKYCAKKIKGLDKMPLDIPKHPNSAYKNKGWVDWNDWLGSDYIANSNKVFRSYEEAKEFVHKLKIPTRREWRKYAKDGMEGLEDLPNDIPNFPQYAYKNKGWKGFPDWLGNGRVIPSSIDYESFEDARNFARSLGLKNSNQWKVFYQKSPIDRIPLSPHLIYKNDGWVSWNDWLGSDYINPAKVKFRSFKSAREYVHTLKIKTLPEWKKFLKGEIKSLDPLPIDIPRSPNSAYKKNGWVSWGDWLGTGNVCTTQRVYKSFKEAKKFIKELKLRSIKDWDNYKKGFRPDLPEFPEDIPKIPHVKYREEWKGFPDWLGY